VAFDYSQMELRLAAIFSGDENLIEIFRKGEDVHTSVASRVFGVPMDAVTKEMRRHAKVINFGILYGMGVNALKQNLGSSREEASNFYQSYFETFTGLAQYLEKIKADAHTHGFTTTYFGRKRYFPGINSRLPHIAAAEERMAVNAPFQGTSADITKLAMVEVEKELQKEELLDKVHILLTIHDELIYEAENEVVKKAIPVITRAMEGVLKESVPITVNAKFGNNWGEME
jgi:DNA polymerase-1